MERWRGEEALVVLLPKMLWSSKRVEQAVAITVHGSGARTRRSSRHVKSPGLHHLLGMCLGYY